MNRRHFLGAAGLLLCASQASAAQDWQARLIRGKRDGNVQWAGLQVMLAPGWKTYWRVPGEAGIPPQITVKGTGISDVAVDYPLPRRLVDASGEAIGYHDEVLFPIRLTLTGNDIGDAKLSAFFGVCQEICKPAKFEGDVASAAEDDVLIAAWQQKVPMTGNFVTAAKSENNILSLNLAQPTEDIFVEGPEGLYFRKPEIKGRAATLICDGLESGQTLKNLSLRLTASVGGKGLEQTVTAA